jgi:hypothetical protein
MPLDNFLAHRQTDSGAWIRVATMEAFEDLEDLLMVLRCDANAIVPN